MKILIAVTLAGITLAGCQSKKATSKEEPAAAVPAQKTLENTYWVLTELQGKPVDAPKDGEKPSYIYFNPGKKRVGMSGGCNVLGGSYELMEGNRIKIMQTISTMMACPDMTKEDGLKKMAEMVDNYAIQGDNLSFAKARMAPVARFKATAPPAGFKTE